MAEKQDIESLGAATLRTVFTAISTTMSGLSIGAVICGAQLFIMVEQTTIYTGLPKKICLIIKWNGCKTSYMPEPPTVLILQD